MTIARWYDATNGVFRSWPNRHPTDSQWWPTWDRHYPAAHRRILDVRELQARKVACPHCGARPLDCCRQVGWKTQTAPYSRRAAHVRRIVAAEIAAHAARRAHDAASAAPNKKEKKR